MEPKVKRMKQHVASQFPVGSHSQPGTMTATQMPSYFQGQPITVHTAGQGIYPYPYWASAATGSPLVQWANAAAGTPVIQGARVTSGPAVKHQPNASMAAGAPLIRRNTVVQPRMWHSVSKRCAPVHKVSDASNCMPTMCSTTSAAGQPLIKCTAAGSPVVQQATNCLSQSVSPTVPANRSALHVTVSSYGSSVQVATMSSDGSALTAAAVSSDGSLMRATSVVSDGSSLHATDILTNGQELHATSVSSDKTSLRATSISSDRSSLQTTAVRCEGSSLRATTIKAAGSTLSAANLKFDAVSPNTATASSNELVGCLNTHSGRLSPQVKPKLVVCEGLSSDSTM